MSALALFLVALAVLVLVGAGIVVGWMVGTNDRQIDILSRRLAADQHIEAATRATLRAMREAVRRRS